MFSASLPPVGFSTYFVVNPSESESESEQAPAALDELQNQDGVKGNLRSSVRNAAQSTGASLSNEFLTVTFDGTTNLLSSLINKVGLLQFVAAVAAVAAAWTDTATTTANVVPPLRLPRRACLLSLS